MAANLDMSNGRVNFAFTGDRNDIWHRMGTAMPNGASLEAWAKNAGLDFEAIRTPAYTQLPDGRMSRIDGWSYLTRNDTLTQLGYVSDASYKVVQPIETLETLNQYVSVDDRFAFDAAGALNGGKRVWATATFNGPMTVAGDQHKARLLCTTSFDGTSATWFNGTMTRVVCQNTLSASLAEKGAQFRVYHSAKFDKVQAGKELARIAKGFEQYKAMGDAMALVDLSVEDTRKLFKKLLDIPFDAKPDEISTRKFNQFTDLSGAYSQTVAEGSERGKAWTALNAVTRYVDHTRSTRNGDSESSARFDSALFGSGAALKAEAWNLLLPMVKDRVAA